MSHRLDAAAASISPYSTTTADTNSKTGCDPIRSGWSPCTPDKADQALQTSSSVPGYYFS